MKRIASLVLGCLAIGPPAFAQQTVPIDLLAILDQIPAPPASVREANERAGCGTESGCDSDRFYGPIQAQLRDIGEQIEIASIASSPQPAGDPLQGLSPEEFKRMVESMSQEEQIRFAMEMQRRGSTALLPESPPVQVALAEAAKIREEIGRQAIGASSTRPIPFASELDRLRADRERKHEEIGEWARSQQVYNSAGVPTEDWWRVLGEAMEKDIAVENEYMQALLLAFHDEVAWQMDFFSTFQELLAAARYGEGAVNAHSRFELLAIQQGMLDASKNLLAVSYTATEEGREWWQEKLAWDREHR